MLIKLISVALCVLGYLVSRAFLVRVIRRLSQRKSVQPVRTAYVLRTVNIGLFMGFFSIALVTVGIGYGDVSVFISSVFAIVGIALFATWSILSNLTASLIIFFAFPYSVGHRIRVMEKDEDMSGVIEEISPFHVLIRRDNGDLITYPNNLILQKAVLRVDVQPAAGATAPAGVADPASPPQLSSVEGGAEVSPVASRPRPRSRFRRSPSRGR